MKKSHHKLTEKIGDSIWTSVNGRNWYNWEHRTWIPNVLMQKMKTQQEVETKPQIYPTYYPVTTIPSFAKTTVPIPSFAKGLVKQIVYCTEYTDNSYRSAIYIDLTKQTATFELITMICRPYFSSFTVHMKDHQAVVRGIK